MEKHLFILSHLQEKYQHNDILHVDLLIPEQKKNHKI